MLKAVLAVIFISLPGIAVAADLPATDSSNHPVSVPDPYGLGERLAIIDFLGAHQVDVVIDEPLESLRAKYVALVPQPPVRSAQMIADERRDADEAYRLVKDRIRVASEYGVEIPDTADRAAIEAIEKTEQERRAREQSRMQIADKSSVGVDATIADLIPRTVKINESFYAVTVSALSIEDFPELKSLGNTCYEVKTGIMHNSGRDLGDQMSATSVLPVHVAGRCLLVLQDGPKDPPGDMALYGSLMASGSAKLASGSGNLEAVDVYKFTGITWMGIKGLFNVKVTVGEQFMDDELTGFSFFALRPIGKEDALKLGSPLAFMEGFPGLDPAFSKPGDYEFAFVSRGFLSVADSAGNRTLVPHFTYIGSPIFLGASKSQNTESDQPLGTRRVDQDRLDHKDALDKDHEQPAKLDQCVTIMAKVGVLSTVTDSHGMQEYAFSPMSEADRKILAHTGESRPMQFLSTMKLESGEYKLSIRQRRIPDSKQVNASTYEVLSATRVGVIDAGASSGAAWWAKHDTPIGTGGR